MLISARSGLPVLGWLAFSLSHQVTTTSTPPIKAAIFLRAET